jgi:hypothetical protein
MNPNLKRAREIFVAAVGQMAPADACGSDEALRDQVRQLLRAHAEAGSFLESPAAAPENTDEEPPAREGPGCCG